MAVGVAVGAEGSFVLYATGDEIVGEFVQLSASDVFKFVDVYGAVEVFIFGAEERGRGDMRGE